MDAAPANGCGHCGEDQRAHAIRYMAGPGFHTWKEPTDAQRKERMVARRKSKKDGA